MIAHVLAPPSGSVEISTPLACVPTHRWTDGQAPSIIPSGTANGSLWSISTGDDQVIVDATAEHAKHPSASAAAVSASPSAPCQRKRARPGEVARPARARQPGHLLRRRGQSTPSGTPGRSAVTLVIVPGSMAGQTRRMRPHFLRGFGLSGSRGQHIHAALERDGMPHCLRALASGPGNNASARLGR